jgi:hypothetical protein
MSLLSRIGYLASYIGVMFLIPATVQTSYGGPDVVLWLLAGLPLLIGLPLLFSDPLPRKLKWRIGVSSSPTGTVGVAITMYGVLTFSTISFPQLRVGGPIESWWLYFVISLVALVLGSVMLLVKPPLMDTKQK